MGQAAFQPAPLPATVLTYGAVCVGTGGEYRRLEPPGLDRFRPPRRLDPRLAAPSPERVRPPSAAQSGGDRLEDPGEAEAEPVERRHQGDRDRERRAGRIRSPSRRSAVASQLTEKTQVSTPLRTAPLSPGKVSACLSRRRRAGARVKHAPPPPLLALAPPRRLLPRPARRRRPRGRESRDPRGRREHGGGLEPRRLRRLHGRLQEARRRLRLARQVQKDWQGTLDHYIRDYGGDGAKRRGKLHFFDLRIELLAPDAAMLTGRYRLEGGGRPQDGINTRLFRKVGGRWVIAMNHVSSREPDRLRPPPSGGRPARRARAAPHPAQLAARAGRSPPRSLAPHGRGRPRRGPATGPRSSAPSSRICLSKSARSGRRPVARSSARPRSAPPSAARSSASPELERLIAPASSAAALARANPGSRFRLAVDGRAVDGRPASAGRDVAVRAPSAARKPRAGPRRKRSRLFVRTGAARRPPPARATPRPARLRRRLATPHRTPASRRRRRVERRDRHPRRAAAVDHQRPAAKRGEEGASTAAVRVFECTATLPLPQGERDTRCPSGGRARERRTSGTRPPALLSHLSRHPGLDPGPNQMLILPQGTRVPKRDLNVESHPREPTLDAPSFSGIIVRKLALSAPS